MASFNEIQVGRINGILHKLLDMKEGAPAPQLSGDVVPTICLESDRPEWKFLGGERLCWGAVDQPAVAGEYSHVQLLNVTPGTLVVVEKVVASGLSGIPLEFWMGHRDTVLPASTQGGTGFRDSRLSRQAITSAATIHYASNVAGIITNVNYRNWMVGPDGAITVQLDNLGIILTPNMGLCTQLRTVNKELLVSFFWRERTLEPAETR